MHTTALSFPLTVPPWQKPTSVIRVLRGSQRLRNRIPGPAVIKPQSKWTVLAAIVLAVSLHIAPVAIVEMKVNTLPVETTQALNRDTVSTTAD